MKLIKILTAFIALVSLQIAAAQWFNVPPPVEAKNLMIFTAGVPVAGGTTCSGDYGNTAAWSDTSYSSGSSFGIIVALKVPLSCGGTVSSATARFLGAVLGTSEAKIVIYSHDSANDRPLTVLLDGTPAYDAGWTSYADHVMAISGAIDEQDYIWVCFVSEYDEIRVSYTGSGSMRSIRLDLTSGEFANDTGVGDSWTVLDNYAGATVATDRDYNIKVTF